MYLYMLYSNQNAHTLYDKVLFCCKWVGWEIRRATCVFWLSYKIIFIIVGLHSTAVTQNAAQVIVIKKIETFQEFNI